MCNTSRARMLLGCSLVLLCSMLILVACGQSAADPARGKALFDGQIQPGDGSAAACSTCHADSASGHSAIGPNLSNIGNRAATRVPGISAADYLRTSIVNP